MSNPNIYECTLNPSLDPFPGRGMKKNNFGLWSDDDGNEFLLTANEVSGPVLKALFAVSHLIPPKSLLGVHDRHWNWGAKRLNDSPKISQLEGGKTQDLNPGPSAMF